MKILIVTWGVPYSLDHGGHLRLYYLSRELTQTHELYLLILCDDPKSLKHLDKIQPFFEHVEWVRVPHKSMPILIRETWHKVAQHYVIDRIYQMLRTNAIDILHFYSPSAGRFATNLKVLATTKILDCVDSANLLYKRNVAQSPPKGMLGLLKHLINKKRVPATERRLLTHFDSTVVVSPRDMVELRTLAPSADVHVIPNGVDTVHFNTNQVKVEKIYDSNILVFVGNMDFKPNVHAMTYFVSQVFPLIRKRVQNVVLKIIGKRPTYEVQALADEPGVEILGFVPDVRVYLQEADVVVIPMVSGGGIKNKVLEAFAMSKGIVVTSMGLEAIVEARHGVHALVADTPHSFAYSVLELLQNRNKSEDLGKNARVLVESLYSWHAKAQTFTKLYNSLKSNPNT